VESRGAVYYIFFEPPERRFIESTERSLDLSNKYFSKFVHEVSCSTSRLPIMRTGAVSILRGRVGFVSASLCVPHGLFHRLNGETLFFS
jgi:hypothetical protein